MSLNGIFATSVSGLQTAQASLRAVSDNIANVNTPGYVRKLVDQQSVVSGSGGVAIAAVRRAADQFLQATSLRAASDSGKAGAVSDLMDQAQALFGDPTDGSSLMGQLDSVFSSFQALSANPTSASRGQAVAAVQGFFQHAGGVSAGLQGLSGQADGRLAADVTQANQLLTQINDLNGPISAAKVTGGDAGDLENRQSQLIDQLSSLMDVQVSARSPGGVTLRTAGGVALVDDGAATLSYDGSGETGTLTVTPAGGQPRNLSAALASGEIKGLLQLRDQDLPAVQAQLAELTSGAASALNAAHNASTAVPAPAALTGRDTGMDLATAVGGFSGKTTVAILDGSGTLVRKVAIDFDAGTMDAGSGPTGFTPSTFLSTLNSALGGAGSASFANGALSLAAAGGNGVAVADDATTPSAKAGRSFSGFFGLNDLVTAGAPADYRTGLTAADPSGFGGQVTFRLTAADGSWLRDATVTLPSGGSMSDLVSALNTPATGVGLYGRFSLSSTGELSFAGAGGAQLSVAKDQSTSAAGSLSLSQMFGIGDRARAARAGSFSVRPDIAASAGKLALGKLDPTAAVGVSAAGSSDASGADALAQAGRGAVSFDPAGGLTGGPIALSDYAASISAAIARKSADAGDAKTSAAAVASTASARRSSAEGVNLDDELVKLTTYQQAYNASARLIQAGKDLYDTLLGMVD